VRLNGHRRNSPAELWEAEAVSNEIRELNDAELDAVSGGDKSQPQNDPPAKLPEDPVITVMRVLGGAIWFL
jgi:hypothetical protein